MSAIVYASAGGSRYHADRDCRAFLAGQMLSDIPDDAPPSLRNLPHAHAVVPTTATEALWGGREPCAVCLPGRRAAYWRCCAGDDYGHEPVWIAGDHFCARCRTPWFDETGDEGTYPTLWPCTSATVLGLVQRDGGAA